MSLSLRFRLTAAVAGVAALLAGLTAAHEDDQKILDRVPAYSGKGMRSGAPGVPGATLPAFSGNSFPASGISLLSWLPLGEFGSPKNANSCWGYTSPSGREYAILGTSSGTGFVEITDPGAPQVVAHIPGPNSLWRDVRTYQSWCYAVSEGGGGIQVMDLASIDSGLVTLTGSVLSGGTEATHTLSINTDTGYLYRAGGGSNGLRVYSLGNPAVPQLVASWSDRYVHEAQTWRYTSGPHAGKEIAFACGGYNGGFSQTGVDILDVTNKQNIFVIKRFTYSNGAYSHQAWLSPDKKYLYLNDELDESGSNNTITKVFDVQSLTNPIEKPQFQNSSTAIGHNLYTKDNRIYEANYRSGLRVFDATNPLQPVEVAWFDTWPDDDNASFNGLWNTYPYFASGVVIGSDIERGLFVWWVGQPLLAFDYPSGQPDPVDPAGELVPLTISEQAGGTLVAGSVQLHYDAGAGMQSLTLVDQGNHTYNAPLPALPCGTLLRWYVSARSQNGFTWTSPENGPNITWITSSATSLALVQREDMESETGWAANTVGDTATEGLWERFDPIGSISQPEDDISPQPGRKAWVTGAPAHVSSTPGSHDVDGGFTSLTSPRLDASGLQNAYVRYWRWFSNHGGPAPQEDVLTVRISNDDGITWTDLEVIGPVGVEATGGWYMKQFRVADFLAPTSTLRVRFVAADEGADSLVDAAVDELELFDYGCPTGPVTVYCTAKPNSAGCVPAISSTGAPSATWAQPFMIQASEVLNAQLGVLFYGHQPAAVPFQGATLCVAPPVLRAAAQPTGGNPLPLDCSGQLAYDFNALIQSGTNPALVNGVQVNVQFWYRDPGDVFGTGLTDALEFVIGQ